MNTGTRQAFLDFIDKVELLTQCVIRDVGMRDAESIIESAEELKRKLKNDETILETS